MTHSRFLGSLLIGSLVLGFTALANADDMGAQQQYQQQELLQKSYQQQNSQPAHRRTYSQKVGDKALMGFTNFVTAPAEIPKDIINLANDTDTNPFYAVIGGLFKGMIHAGERGAVGLMDLFTAPIPTEPNIYPNYVWDDYGHDTTYGKVFRLDKNGHKIDPNLAPNPNIPQQR